MTYVTAPKSDIKQVGNVFAESASAVAAILDLHFPEGSILDVNFGLGTFYQKTNRKVTGFTPVTSWLRLG